ncbi:MAG: AlbA family DNA-binding domain-containing protein, partial [Solirubrobacteraceae bacterium]
MVTLSELSELLREGENSGVKFKRDDVQPHDFAKELVALSNLRGGRILLGVEDDGTISGLVRDAVDEWVLTIARDKV